MRLRGKSTRIKSEVAQLDYISPWKAPQESGRIEIETLLNRGRILE